MTHAQLVEAGAKYLRRTCPVVITEVATSFGEIPDVIGWEGQRTVLIECKASRADFLADAAKPERLHPERGCGALRYYLAPPGVIRLEDFDLASKWGVLEASGRTVRKRREASPQERNRAQEAQLLISVIRRIGTAPIAGVSIKAFTMETLARATVAIEPPACAESWEI